MGQNHEGAHLPDDALPLRPDLFDFSDHADRVAFRELLSRLSLKNRIIADMAMAGYTQTEIGAVIGLAQGNVSRRLKKIREALKFCA